MGQLLTNRALTRGLRSFIRAELGLPEAYTPAHRHGLWLLEAWPVLLFSKFADWHLDGYDGKVENSWAGSTCMARLPTSRTVQLLRANLKAT